MKTSRELIESMRETIETSFPEMLLSKDGEIILDKLAVMLHQLETVDELKNRTISRLVRNAKVNH